MNAIAIPGFRSYRYIPLLCMLSMACGSPTLSQDYESTSGTRSKRDQARESYLLGKELEGQRKYPDAKANYKTALELEPGCASCAFSLAQLYGKIGWPDSGMVVCDRYLSIDSSDANIYYLRGFLGLVANSQGGNDNLDSDSIRTEKRQTAIKFFSAAIEKDSTIIRAFRDRASAHLWLGDTANAISDLEIAVHHGKQLDPGALEYAKKKLKELKEK